MPNRTIAIDGAPCWVDLMTSDPARSREFYTQLFGWTAEEPNMEFGGYFNFNQNGVRVAGCMASQPGSDMPDLWSVYLASVDINGTLEGATRRGGQVLMGPMNVGDLGAMGVVTDAGGAAIGVWQPGTFQGFGVFAETGTPSWFELSARDYPASIDFYRDVFGWDALPVSDTPEFRYTVLRHGEDWLAGIMDAGGFLPEGVPPHWSVYFGVDDTDAALTRVTELGGEVVMGAEDTPYGRLATAADPTGALFKLVAPNEATRASGG
jgi:uncharacterized protein